MLKTFLAGLALAGGVGLFTPSAAEAGDWSIDLRFGSHGRGYDCYTPRYYDWGPRYSYPRYSYRSSYGYSYRHGGYGYRSRYHHGGHWR